MNTRKRHAEDPLLPLRAAKQPRIRRNHPNGGNSTPSEVEGILTRWMKLGKDFFQLGRDTLTSWFCTDDLDATSEPIPGPSSKQPSRPPRPSAPLPSRRPTRPPTPPELHDSPSLPFRPLPQRGPENLPPSKARLMDPDRSPSPDWPQSQRGPENLPLTKARLVTPRPRLNSALDAPVASSSSPPKPLKSILRNRSDSDPRSTSRKSSHQSPPKSGSTRTALAKQDPILAAALQERAAQKKKYVVRDHIYAAKHRAQVKANQAKLQQEVDQEWRQMFNVKRQQGYSSDFPTFISYKTYRETLLALEAAPITSQSAVDLRSTSISPVKQRDRRHSDPEASFRWSLEVARKSLAEPKPPKPFDPLLESRRLAQQAKDKEIENRLRPKLPEHLPKEDEEAVNVLFSKRGIISKTAREQVSDKDLIRLRPNQWLNDEIINFYGQLIMNRSEECKENSVTNGRKKPLKAHYFSTFFWTKLTNDGYEKGRLAKWTKKIDIFSKDVILIPVNHSNTHWTAAAINFRRKRIESYDSMGMPRQYVFKTLRDYLDAEHRNKKKKLFDFTGWEDYVLEDVPQQENGFDCGVFTCQFLESLSRGEETFQFQQSNMPYLRRRMAWEIGHAKLRDDP